MDSRPPLYKSIRTGRGRILIVIGLAVAALAAAGAAYHVAHSPCAIYVNGEPVASLASRVQAGRVLAEVRRLGSDGVPGSAVRFADDVGIGKPVDGGTLSTPDAAVEAVRESAAVETRLVMILVDGKPVAGLRNHDDAVRALALVREYYDKRLRNPIGKSTLAGTVSTKEDYVRADKYYPTPEAACKALTAVIEPAITHTVLSGDLAVSIAERYGIPFDELAKLHPDVNLERLDEGDKLVIRRAKRPVTVLSKAMVVETVEVHPMGDPSISRSGKRVMKMMVTYENGDPVERDVLSQITTWERPRYRRHRTAKRPADAGKTSTGAAPTSSAPTRPADNAASAPQ